MIFHQMINIIERNHQDIFQVIDHFEQIKIHNQYDKSNNIFIIIFYFIIQICQETENQPTITTLNSQTTSYQINSTATTILDDQSSSLIMMPITSAPIISSPIIIEQQQQQVSYPSDILTSPKTDLDRFIDQQLQATLEKCLKNHLSTNENIQQQQQQRKTRLSKSETEKLLNELDFTKQICNLEHYEKQVRNNLY